MGNDGGSIAKRDELVRTKATTEKADPELIREALWSLCVLSKKPLREPIVSDALGRLYNKDAVVMYLLERQAGSKEGVANDPSASHIRGLKDVKELKLTRNPDYKLASPTTPASSDSSTVAPFACPLTSKEMNGKHRFVYLSTCGCTMSESGLKAVISVETKSKRKPDSELESDLRSCPQCGEPFHANGLAKGKDVEVGGQIVPLNPPPEEQEELRKAMEVSRAQEEAKKKETKKLKSKRAHEEEQEDSAERAERKRKKAEKKAARENQIAALQAELAS